MRRTRYIAGLALLIAAAVIPSQAIRAGSIASQNAMVLHTYRKSTAMEVINAIPVDFHKVLPLLPEEYTFLPAAAVGLGEADQALVVIANFQGSHPQIDDEPPATADQVAIDLAILVQEPDLASAAGLDIPGAFHAYTLAIYTNDGPYAATLQEVGMPVELAPDIVYDRPMDDLTGVGDLNVTVPLDAGTFYSHNTGFGYAPAGVLNAILWHNGNRGTSVLHFMDEPTELGQAISTIYTAPGSELNELLDGGGLGPGPFDPLTGFESVMAPSLNYRYREGSFGRLLLFVPEPNTLYILAFGLATVSTIGRLTHRRAGRVLLIAVALLPLVAFAAAAHADIHQWEYIDPADPSQGKRQSTTLTPDGAGVDAVPGANLSSRNLTMAYLIGADLTNANFWASTLTDADLTNAEVHEANFGRGPRTAAGTVITLAQLYTTSSYQAKNLTGIGLGGHNLGDGDFADQILTNADFPNAYLERATLESADLSHAYLGSANLKNSSFVGARLIFASFAPDCFGASLCYGHTELTGADFTGAEIQGANFTLVNGFTAAQLYSTASYLVYDLKGVSFTGNNLSNWNFAGQNLTDASFGQAYLSGVDFTAADVRGASLSDIPASAITTNLIRRDGHIDGLDLDTGGLLVVRDHDGRPELGPGYPPISITVDQHMTMAPGGALRMVFEADDWDSTISFAPGIPVTLGGTLELTFADDVNLASQLGRTFDVFNWTGVTPNGVFTVASPYDWNLSRLYTTGEVTLIAVPEPACALLMAGALCRTSYRRRRIP